METISIGAGSAATGSVESLLSALPYFSPAEWLFLAALGVAPALVGVAGLVLPRVRRAVVRARARRRFRRYDHLTARQVREADAARGGA